MVQPLDQLYDQNTSLKVRYSDSLYKRIDCVQMAFILVQSGLEYRTFEFRIHSKTKRFHVLYWDGSVFERSEPFMVFGFRMAVSLDRFINMKKFFYMYKTT